MNRAKMNVSDPFSSVDHKKGRHDGGPVLVTLFLNANCLDLLLSVALGLEGSRTNLDPGGL